MEMHSLLAMMGAQCVLQVLLPVKFLLDQTNLWGLVNDEVAMVHDFNACCTAIGALNNGWQL